MQNARVLHKRLVKAETRAFGMLSSEGRGLVDYATGGGAFG